MNEVGSNALLLAILATIASSSSKAIIHLDVPSPSGSLLSMTAGRGDGTSTPQGTVGLLSWDDDDALLLRMSWTRWLTLQTQHL